METWAAIKDFEGYEVSSLGNVRSACGRHRKLSTKANGYLQVTLKNKERSRNFYVHRLVASAFLPVANPYFDVNHKDGVRNNNKLENLEWASRKDNIHHAIKSFGSMCGSKHSQAKLSYDQVEDIRASIGSSTLLAKQYNVSSSHIRAIKGGKRWSNELARVG